MIAFGFGQFAADLFYCFVVYVAIELYQANWVIEMTRINLLLHSLKIARMIIISDRKNYCTGLEFRVETLTFY